MLGPLLLIVLGVLFLLNNMYSGVFCFGKMWSVILIVIGLSKVVEFFRGPRTESTSTDTKKEGQV